MDRDQSPRLIFIETPRASHLCKIWRALVSQAQLPQVDRWLAQYFRSQKQFGQEDRQWYSHAVFQGIRLGYWALTAESMLTFKRGAWGADHEDFLQTNCPSDLAPTNCWKKIRELPPERLFLWLSLRDTKSLPVAYLMSPEAEVLELWQGMQAAKESSFNARLLWQGIPLYYAKELERRKGLSGWTAEAMQKFLSSQSRQAPLWIRLYPWAKPLEMEQQLLAANYTIDKRGESWALQGGKGLQNLACFLDGWLEIQDHASQSIGRAAGAKEVPFIWDCCAGGGGKTLQMAAAFGPKQTIFASDVRPYKLDALQLRAERARLKNIKYLDWSGEKLPKLPISVINRGGFDRILVDAPCSAAGTWRRSPDARFRCDASELKALLKIQLGICTNVLAALKPGGHLVYSTCSWLPAENEEIVAAVLTEFPQLELKSMQLSGCPEEDADTMFFAVMQLKA